LTGAADNDDYRPEMTTIDPRIAEIARLVRDVPDFPKPGDRKSTRLNSSHLNESRMPSSA